MQTIPVPDVSPSDVFRAVRAEIAEQYSEDDNNRPWVVGVSWGKDSTLLAQLVLEHIYSLPPEKRTRPIVIVMNDTLVENPVMQSHADTSFDAVEAWVQAESVGVEFIRTIPKLTDTFWVCLLGRGYRAPTRDFRWCTERLKIRPKRDIFAAYPQSLLLVGTRRSESTHRAAGFDRRETGNRVKARENGTGVFEPLEHVTDEQLWAFLLQNPPPWGGSHRELITVYRNAISECPVVMSIDDAPSCGTQSARYGCWTCTVVKKDRSLRGLADNTDDDRLEPLLDFRDRLRDVSDDPSNRDDRRRNGQPGNGPIRLPMRRALLGELLALQEETGLPLISQAELTEIDRIWRNDGDREPLTDGELAFDVPLAFPSVRGSQSGREFYLAAVPLADLVRVTRVSPEAPDAHTRYQRDVSWKRAGEVCRYLLNATPYSLPPLTCVADGVQFVDGRVTLTPESTRLLVDGQHRRAGIELALERDRTLGTDTVGLLIYPYTTVDDARQVFTDLNGGKPVPKSIRLFLDRRSDSTARAAAECHPFVGLVDVVRTSVSTRSPHLWTLSALAQTDGIDDAAWWKRALPQLPGFLDVVTCKTSAAVARNRWIWPHGVTLRALGIVKGMGGTPDQLARIAWERLDTRWQGVALSGRKMLASNAAQIASEIMRQLNMFEV